MEHFVTLFDSLFLPQGLALHRSMERHIDKYQLWILCVDDEAYEILNKLNLNNVNLLKLSAIETQELLRVKADRSKVEYCWTLTPFAPKFVFEADKNITRVTYIDADLWFLKSPDAIYLEFEKSNKKVLITEHSFMPEGDSSFKAGTYCVQFIVFRKDSEEIRNWWEQRCIDWCFARYEDGKFGDQKYLDLWPEIFPDDVHVLTKHDLTQAPWNASKFAYSKAIFYHFHALRITSKSTVNVGPSPIPIPTEKNVYQPYLSDLKFSLNLLMSCGYKVKFQANRISIFKKITNRIARIIRFIQANFRSGEMTF